MSALQVKDVLTKTTQFFRDKGFETARLDSELLISSALKWERMKLYLNYEYPLSDEELAACRENVKRRTQGEPVAYILGKKDFYNHTFNVTPAVLIPRPETEQIVEETTKWMKAQAGGRIVDIGTGSGCIALSLLAELPEAQALAVDISDDSITVARGNAEIVKVAERAHFLTLDASRLTSTQVIETLGAKADAVVANPPYIAENDPAVEANVRKFEPSHALFSSESGLQHIRAWSRVAADIVRAGGWVMFEIGYEQGRAAKEIFESTGYYDDVTIVKDMAGHERFIRALRKQET